MTQAELAKELGVHPLTVSQWETGFRHPSSLAMKAVEMLKELRGGDNFIEVLQGEARETFDRFNKRYFNSELRQKYEIVFSKQMRSTQGTALPQKKIIFLSMAEIEKSDWGVVEETLKHEMVHCWLYEKGKAWGHNREFKARLREITAWEQKSPKGRRKNGHMGLKRLK